MTRHEAIQEQIDQIMDTFDFEEIHDWMTHVGWGWGSTPAVPDLFELKREARQRLKDAAKHGSCSTGGFTATRYEDVDGNGPWIKLELHFGYQSLNDGTSYTK